MAATSARGRATGGVGASVGRWVERVGGWVGGGTLVLGRWCRINTDPKLKSRLRVGPFAKDAVAVSALAPSIFLPDSHLDISFLFLSLSLSLSLRHFLSLICCSN